MFLIAWKNLRQDLTRAFLSIGGVAASVLLILALEGVFAGVAGQLTAYIDKSGADVMVAQAGVRNMHMATSVLPPDAQARVAGVPGVRRVVPITFYASKFKFAGENLVGFVIGVDRRGGIGGPWRMARGRTWPESGEAVISRSRAAAKGLAVGDRVKVADRWFTISGLSEETGSFVSSFVFVNIRDARSLQGVRGATNYLLVKAAKPGESEALAGRIQNEVPGVTALTREALAQSDRDVAIQMGLSVIQAMSVAALAIGLAVITLTLYAATVEKSREYGILKALGANNRQLFGIVLSQALLSTLTGFAVGALTAWVVSRLVAIYVPEVSIVLEWAAVGRVLPLVMGLAAVASLLPAWRIARVDPLVVFRG